mgnify:CR=1 FL=1
MSCRYSAAEWVGKCLRNEQFLYWRHLYTVRLELRWAWHIFSPCRPSSTIANRSEAMWRERSVQRIRRWLPGRPAGLQHRIARCADTNYVTPEAFWNKRYCGVGTRGVVGRYCHGILQVRWLLRCIPLNAARERTGTRYFKRAKHALHRLRISQGGLERVLHYAAGFRRELIVDEPTARALLWPDTDDSSTDGRSPPKSKSRG